MPAGRTVMAGSGPLLWLLAAQMLRAGGQDRGDPRHHAARATGCARCCICRTSPLSPYLVQGPGAAARGEGQGAGRSASISARGRGRRTSCAEVAFGTAPASGGCRPTCCCCIRASCPTSTSPWRPASRIAGTAASSASSRCSTSDFDSSVRRHRRRGRRRGHRRRHGGGRARPDRGHRRGAGAEARARRAAAIAGDPPALLARGDGPRASSTRCTSRPPQFRRPRATRSSAAARR